MNDPKMKVLANLLNASGLDAKLRAHPAHMATDMTGPNQIIVTSQRGKISIIKGACSFGDFEIYCTGGDLFDDVERFETVDETVEAVCDYLWETTP